MSKSSRGNRYSAATNCGILLLVGGSVLDHLDMSAFPAVSDPENYLLAGHCGYLGVLPQTETDETWTLRASVLDIFEGRGGAIDARLPLGDVQLVKLNPDCAGWTVVEAELQDYVQTPESGMSKVAALIHIENGPALLESITSQHYVLTSGATAANFRLLSRVFDLDLNLL